jgi:hypothetical protein
MTEMKIGDLISVKDELREDFHKVWEGWSETGIITREADLWSAVGRLRSSGRFWVLWADGKESLLVPTIGFMEMFEVVQ